MAAKTKRKAKAKPRLHTWSVNIDGALTHIEAEQITIHQAAVEFETAAVVVRAIAAGHWVTIELLDEGNPSPTAGR